MSENKMSENKEQVIYHHSPFIGGNSSEYIVINKNTKIDITSHGMGSGIYGLSHEYINKNPVNQPYETKSKEYTFKIDKPYRISTEKQCERSTSASKQVMRDLQEVQYKTLFGNSMPDSGTVDNLSTVPCFLDEISKKFLIIMNGDNSYEEEKTLIIFPQASSSSTGVYSDSNPKLSNNKIFHVSDNLTETKKKVDIEKNTRYSEENQEEYKFNQKNVISALTKFIKDYNEKTTGEQLEMPINYILKEEGFDGVMSAPYLSCHSWSKGDVKFIDYPTNKIGDKIHVSVFLGRNGIFKPVKDFSENDNYIYNFENNLWCKNP